MAHTERLVAHSVRFNQSFRCLESMAELVNSTPNASIHVPKSIYKMKKTINPGFDTEFHIKCASCKNYSIAKSTQNQIECEICSNKITASDSNYFVYIPLKQQLIKSVNENLNQIQSYRINNTESSTMNDIHDSIQYKRIKSNYRKSIVLSLAVFTDGVALHKSSNKSVWVIQLIRNYLHPNVRYNLFRVLTFSSLKTTKCSKLKLRNSLNWK